MSDTEALIEEWALSQRAAGRADTTVQHRLEVLDLYRRRSGDADIVRCGWTVPAAFLQSAPSQGTTWNYYMVLKVWYRWLHERRKVIPENPMAMIDAPRMPRRIPKPYTDEELTRILSVGMYRRTRAMILLAALQGMRAAEIATIRGEWIEDGMIRIRGKGDKERMVPLHPAVAAELVPHFPTRGYWFTSPADRSKPMTRKSVSNVIGRVARRAGVPRGGAHRFRHNFGTAALENANLREAQELLGHASPTTTMGYTQVRPQRLAEVVGALALPEHERVSRRPLAATS